ncbi:multidrug effflux MFS transporter [Flavobacterium muglaense]|uniref:Multidrug effflux MFS transporter n=1 Tax=Flavobacterium muglaense TaxID=2764716 RepID=A0A923N1S2_9FLAO|nr:multidrug effflux MFS transporter [Flavobacterium muglaense]MBC5839339.1 multidrug effflux MFS transporter [Flavobacterium muglaense]MBC5845851.1 multidrug effflux MFS transporter [Flavobacterium muglaense]
MQKNTRTSQFEFVALMASLMSVVALAIDALLPALDSIGISIGTTNVVDNQLLITMIFLGLGFGPLFFGPLSDSIGRKPVVFMGFALFIGASFICVNATSLEMMVLGRILQGIGLSAPRTISIAIIRDQFSGDYMARIMSFVTVVFILVPVVAPAMGKFVLDYYNWHGIFYIQVLISLLVSFWFWKRQPETLSIENKKVFSKKGFIAEFKELLKFKRTIGFTIISGLVTGSFMVYLSSSQQIFENQYHLKAEFPYIFAGLAIAIGAAVFLNAVLVIKFGMEKLITIALCSFFLVSATYVAFFYNSPNPALPVLIAFFALQFFSIGFLFGNVRAMAMEPVGHIAGIAAAVTGFISTIMAVPISIYIGRFIGDTALPLFIGFSICAGLGICLLIYLKIDAKRGTIQV